MADLQVSKVESLVRDIASALGSDGAGGLAKALASTLKPEDVKGLVDELTHALIATLNLPPEDYTQDLRRLLSMLSNPSSLRQDSLLTVMSPSHYQALREALALNTFQQVEGSPWPTASLSKGKARGEAQLRPPLLDANTVISPEEQQSWSQMMWSQREALSDLDADVLDALSAIWLTSARTPQQDAITDIDSLLAMRGLKPKKNGNGHGVGYRPEQRTEIFQALSHIQNLWLNMTELEVYSSSKSGRLGKPSKQVVQSRAFVITDRMGQLRFDGCIDVQRIVFRPGTVFAHYLFGPGRQTALLSAQALHYDPYRQDWEKRLTRYFSWQWKCQASSGCETSSYRIKTLLEAAGAVANAIRPGRTRDRLEKALEALQRDGVIAGWQYELWDEHAGQQHGWIEAWLNTKVLVKCPEAVKVRYRSLERSQEAPAVQAIPENPKTLGLLAQRLRSTRKAHSLSQIQVAEQLQISQSYLSLLERQRVASEQITPSVRKKLEDWLAKYY
jgi:DNA-binding XRE family transcriptional regulator